LSLGIPVIISKYTGLTEEIQKQNAGIVVDPFSEEEIKNAILTMCDDEKYFVYKKNAESFVWPQTWNSLFKQYESIISSVCNKS
jgi:glycosyltransferase involved in cell wall biosynthesis